MRAQLLHLSGPLRGRTITYPQPLVRIGSSDASEARMVSKVVSDHHAEIEWVKDQCQFHLRAVESSVFVNGNEVEEVILKDGDLLEFGAGGPMARFRISLGSVNVVNRSNGVSAAAGSCTNSTHPSGSSAAAAVPS